MASYWLGKESRHVVRWSHYHRLGARSDLTCCSGKIKILGSFSIDDGDSGEKVTFKMNSRFFKLHHAYSNSLKMSNVGEFPWS